jgi:allantoate deiminase
VTLHERLAELAALGATGDGIDRALFTAAERAARERFVAWARADGLRVEQDRAGNVFARLDAARGSPEAHEAALVQRGTAIPGDASPVQCGSHLDTVRNGGAYDGAYGVVGGLEALRRIAASGERPPRALEVVAWAGEEGSRFPLGCLGSSVYAGLTAYEDVAALVGDDGETFAAAVRGPHGLLGGVPVRDGFPPPAAYVELHIEQGPVMEREGARLGIVSAIAGQRRFRVTVGGVAGHAGTVPMRGRADALCAASEIVLAVERAALDADDTVATVGHLVVDPNQTNIVPGRVVFRIDLRSVDDGRIDAAERTIRARAATVAERRGVTVSVETLESRAAVPMETRMRLLVRAACNERDPRAITIASGAGHDAMCVAHVAPTAMIFVPSIGGRSHVGDERTAPADLDLGVEALAATLLAAAHAPPH